MCSRITLFNARRGGEPCRMTMKQWLDRKKCLGKADEDLTDEEKASFSEMEIIYLNTKGNKIASCLFPLDVIEATDLLCSESFRSLADVSTQNSYLFANRQFAPPCGWLASYKICLCKGKCALDRTTGKYTLFFKLIDCLIFKHTRFPKLLLKKQDIPN